MRIYERIWLEGLYFNTYVSKAFLPKTFVSFAFVVMTAINLFTIYMILYALDIKFWIVEINISSVKLYNDLIFIFLYFLVPSILFNLKYILKKINLESELYNSIKEKQLLFKSYGWVSVIIFGITLITVANILTKDM